MIQILQMLTYFDKTIELLSTFYWLSIDYLSEIVVNFNICQKEEKRKKKNNYCTVFGTCSASY